MQAQVVTADLERVRKRIPDELACIRLLEELRWNGTPRCPYCASTRQTRYRDGARYHCNGCYTSYSVTVNSPFHHTHLSLQKWFLAVVLILGSRRSVPARHLASHLSVSKNTAWLVDQRIRLALKSPDQRILLEALYHEVDGDTPQ